MISVLGSKNWAWEMIAYISGLIANDCMVQIIPSLLWKVYFLVTLLETSETFESESNSDSMKNTFPTS